MTQHSPMWLDLSEYGEPLCETLKPIVFERFSRILIAPTQVSKLPAGLKNKIALVLQENSDGKAIDSMCGQNNAIDMVVYDEERFPGPQIRSGLSLARKHWIAPGDNLENVLAGLGAVDVVLLSFAEATNIGLELIMATAQNTKTFVVKEVISRDDAITALGVLESGPDAISFKARCAHDVQTFLDRAPAVVDSSPITLVEATVTSIRYAGMGARACVDVCAMFEPDEGMIVGSTSSGGLVVCAEVYPLPYMPSRPFRVNAGGVHSYILGPSGHLPYLTDLCAGSLVLATTTSGYTRTLVVGRVKIEVRPLRLIVCKIEQDTISILLQDDWHIRLFDAENVAKNLTDIRNGDKLLGHPMKSGRHAGIAVKETIVEV